MANCKPTKKKKNVEKKSFGQKVGSAFKQYSPVAFLALAGLVVVASGLLGPPKQAQPDPFDWPVSYEEVKKPVESEVARTEVAREPVHETAPVVVAEATPVAPEAKPDAAQDAPRVEPVAPVVEVQKVEEHFKIPAADPPKEDIPVVTTFSPTANAVVTKPVKVEKKKEKKKDKKPTKKKAKKASSESANDIFMANFTRGLGFNG